MAEIQGAPQAPATRADRLYETEALVHKASMTDSDFRITIMRIIDQSLLSQRCKLALFAVVNMAFDKNVVLANNKDLERRILQFKEALNKAKLSYTRPDVMNPEIVIIHETSLQHFIDFVSRSEGGYEREKQGETKTVQDVRYSDREPSGSQQQQQRGFDMSLGGNK